MLPFGRQRRQDDTLYDLAIQLIPFGSERQGHTMVELMIQGGLVGNTVEATKEPGLQRRLGVELSAAGWTKARRMVDGVQAMRWFPPKYAPKEVPLAAGPDPADNYTCFEFCGAPVDAPNRSCRSCTDRILNERPTQCLDCGRCLRHHPDCKQPRDPTAGTGTGSRSSPTSTPPQGETLLMPLDAAIDWLAQERMELRQSGDRRVETLKLMAWQDRAVNGLRAFRAARPETVLTPAHVEDLGGTGQLLERVTQTVAMIPPDTLDSVDWKELLWDVRRMVEEDVQAAVARRQERLTERMGLHLSPSLFQDTAEGRTA